MAKIYLFILCAFSIIQTYGQKTKLLKTETEIRYKFCNPNSIRIDTTIRNYDSLGFVINYYSRKTGNRKVERFIFIRRIETISNDKNTLHQRYVYGDSSFQDIFTHTFKDSCIIYSINKKDTNSITKNYYKNKKIIKSIIVNFDESKKSSFDLILYESYSKMRVKGMKYRTNEYGRCFDSFKFDSLFRRNTFIKRKYNAYKKEWFVAEKSYYGKRKGYRYSRYYHDHFDKYYFHERIIFRYNKFGYRTKTSEYHSNNELCILILYSYEYY